MYGLDRRLKKGCGAAFPRAEACGKMNEQRTGPARRISPHGPLALLAYAYRTAVAANFFTIASSSLRSLSFRLVE